MASHAESSLIYPVERIALNLDDPALSVLGQNPTAGRTFSASGTVPGGLTGDHVIRGLYQGVERLGGLGRTASRKRKTSYTGNFQEGSAVHLTKGLSSGYAGWG